MLSVADVRVGGLDARGSLFGFRFWHGYRMRRASLLRENDELRHLLAEAIEAGVQHHTDTDSIRRARDWNRRALRALAKVEWRRA